MILHIDMDAFFAAVEQRDNPGFRGKPVVISGHSKRSVVSTASYEARKFGIHSAMPLFQAKQRCRNLIIVPGNKAKYSADSRLIMEILTGFSPLVEPVSIDEAYVDISGSEKLFGPPEILAKKIKTAIFSALSLTCSIGIAPVKFLAKIASDMDKPNGITHITHEQMDRVISRLPIEKVPGVGIKIMDQMDALQITTLGDIRRFDIGILNSKFGKQGQRLFELSRGIDNTQVATCQGPKSISSENTLPRDIFDFPTIKKIILAHSQQVGRDLRKKKMLCKNVSIKIKFSDFTQVTRSKKTDSWICSSTDIFNTAVHLAKRLTLKKKIRLIGVGVSRLRSKQIPVQMDLLSLPDETGKKQWESVDRAVDSVLEKFGKEIINKASLKD